MPNPEKKGNQEVQCLPAEDERKYAYVSHKNALKDRKVDDNLNEPHITTDNHGLWLGKIFRQGTVSKVKKTMEWGKYQEEEKIYSPEFIESALDYLFHYLKPGEKVRVYICRAFSELFNGQQDVANTLNVREEMELIKNIARKLKRDPSLIEFVNIDEDPEHRDLMSALHESVNPKTGRVDIKKVAQTNDQDFKLPAEPTSLEIFQLLYNAYQESEELNARLWACVPEKVQDSKATEEEKEICKFYGMTELAIRMRELLSGRYIHSGVTRQALYDGLIKDIIKDCRRNDNNPDKKNKKSQQEKEITDKRKFPELDSLGQLFIKDGQFETVHISADAQKSQNPFVVKAERIRKYIRRAVYAGMAAAGIASVSAGSIAAYSQHEQQKRDQIEKVVDAEINKRIQGMTFYEEWPVTKHPKEQNVEIFKITLEKMKIELARRYQIPADLIEELNPMLKAYLLNNFQSSMPVDQNCLSVASSDITDSFVKEYALFFQQRGIVLARPYSNLEPYLHLIDKSPAEDITIELNEDNPANALYIPNIKGSVKFIGGFKSPHCSGAIYKLYLYKDLTGEEHVLTAKLDTTEDVDFIKSQYTREVLDEYILSEHNYDANNFNGEKVVAEKLEEFWVELQAEKTGSGNGHADHYDDHNLKPEGGVALEDPLSEPLPEIETDPAGNVPGPADSGFHPEYLVIKPEPYQKKFIGKSGIADMDPAEVDRIIADADLIGTIYKATYTDKISGLTYEIIYRPQQNERGTNILKSDIAARYPGEANYSVERAMEAAELFVRAKQLKPDGAPLDMPWEGD